jgi:hypothetical protein
MVDGLKGYNFENLRRAIIAMDNREKLTELCEAVTRLEEIYATKATTPEDRGLERFMAIQDFTYKGKAYKRGDLVLVTAKEAVDRGFIVLGYLKREALK